MAQVMRTEDEPPASRLDYWHSVVGDSLVPLDMSTDAGTGDYRGKLVHADLGAAQFVELTASPLLVRRTPKLISRSDPGLFKIEMHTRGASTLIQGDRETVLRPGTVAIVDTSRPYQMAAGHPSDPTTPPDVTAQLVTLMLPRSMLPLPASTLAAASGMPLEGRTSIDGLVTATLAELARRATAGDDATAARLVSVTADLIAIELSLAVHQTSAVAPEARRRALVWRICAFIEAHLADVGLSPVSIAAAHHVSVRYLHKVFEQEGQTVAERIRTRRLEHCRNDLDNPALRNHSVGAIAARWGFSSLAHFNRLFRATYGVPPGTYRQLDRGRAGRNQAEGGVRGLSRRR